MHKHEMKGSEINGSEMNGSMINWNQVYYFSVVAARGSIKEAAERLELSPSTLSEHIAQLEEDLNVRLFFRQHRKLTLTPEGNRLFLRAKEMFEAGQRLIDVISPVPLGHYPISVGLVPSPSLQLAYDIVGSFLGSRQGIDLKLFHAHYAELEAGLAAAKFDFGFSDRLPERKDIESRLLSSSVVRFYVSQKFNDHSFSDLLAKLPILICNAEPDTRSFAELALADSGLSPSGVVTADYPSALFALCEKGLGIGVFSEQAVRAMAADGLRSLRAPKDAPRLSDHLYVLWAKNGENTEAVRRLKEVIKG